MTRSKLGWSVIAVVLCAAAVLHAQDEPAAAPPGTPMPTFKGNGKVTDAINMDTGAIFDIGGGFTMMFPKGLPVGRSRLVTLQRAKSLPGNLVHAKWKPLGPAVDFSGAFNTSGKPIVVAWAMRQDPVKRGLKLVIAVEVGSFCEGPNKAFKLKGGLCSGFELHDAEYDDGGRRVVANLRATAALRMQFGLVPDDR